jgi:predicted ester cyclase
MGIPPTGKQVSLGGVAIDRLVDGQVAETWLEADVLGMLQQLGVVPAPARA